MKFRQISNVHLLRNRSNSSVLFSPSERAVLVVLAAGQPVAGVWLVVEEVRIELVLGLLAQQGLGAGTLQFRSGAFRWPRRLQTRGNPAPSLPAPPAGR